MICCSRFETKGPLRPFFYLLTPLPVKIRREMGKNSELILRAIVYAAAAVFRLSICCSPFGNRSASKANGVENRFQISHYWPCVKIRGGKNYTEEITASEQLSELLSHDWDEYMHYVQCKASCGGIHQSNVGVNQLLWRKWPVYGRFSRQRSHTAIDHIRPCSWSARPVRCLLYTSPSPRD